jgi:protocatechuate 3,4-dioxygenase, alpha subunit
MAVLILTPSQTIGPFYGSALISDELACAVAADDPRAIAVTGTLVDGEGPFAYPSGVIELWDSSQFVRAQTNADGEYRVVVRRPDSVAATDDPRPHALHLNVAVFGRGLLKPLLTRMYFPGQDEALVTDPVLELVAPARRHALLARPRSDGSLTFDVRIQGADESVFFTR